MLGPMTPAAERALATAARWAAGLGETSLRPFHLLLALLDEEEGRAAELLRRAGMAPAAARALLTPHLSFGALPPFRAVSNSRETESALLRAREVAVEVSADRTVATEHLLLAVLQAESDLARTLVAGGLDLHALEKQVLPNEAPTSAWRNPRGKAPGTRKSVLPVSWTRRRIGHARRCACWKTTAGSPWTTLSSPAN